MFNHFSKYGKITSNLINFKCDVTGLCDKRAAGTSKSAKKKLLPDTGEAALDPVSAVSTELGTAHLVFRREGGKLNNVRT